MSISNARIRDCALAAIFLTAATPAFASDCDPVIAAQAKQYATPYRAHSVMHHADSDDLIIDSVNTADTRYVKMSGTLSNDWTHSPLDVSKDVSDYRHNARQQRWSCHIERSEAIGGDMTDVYVIQDRDSDAIQSRSWISRALGLPLRIETYLDQSSDRPATNTSLYEYNDVKPPEESPPSP